MSEAERRTGYSAERILIDASRILSPQFGAQGIFLSGAQVELLRNAVAYLGRDTTFVDEYHDCYYLRVTDSDFDTIQAIVADLEDKLLMVENTMFGYSERLVIDESDVCTGASVTTLVSGTVPAGELWILESFVVLHDNAAVRKVLVAAEVSGTVHYVTGELAVPSEKWHGGGIQATMAAGEQLSARFYDMDTDDLIRLRAQGYIMVVPE